MLDRRLGLSASMFEERINTEGAEVFMKSCLPLPAELRLDLGVLSLLFRRNLNVFLFSFSCGELGFGLGPCCGKLGSGPTKDAVLAS